MNKVLKLIDIKNILESRVANSKFTTLKSLPQPDSFKDIQKATDRIITAINNHETINIVGDYDADGIVSTTIMIEFFSALGVDVNYIIPNRFEHGYGLSPLILEQIYDGIIITVDNGISAFEAGQICKQRGLDLIITDHHTVGETLPEAYAIINPKQDDCNFPYKDICGALVAWYLCANIKKTLKFQYNLMGLFDILCIAIVADIMPMVSINQTIVKAGLKAFINSTRPSIVALKERFDLKTINEEDIGFKIAPLINCAGRMADPHIALEFLLSFDIYEANMQLDYLLELNEQRKEDQLQIFNEAKLQVEPEDNVIVVSSKNWNEGIIGIVASKLCDKYKKPAFVFSIDNSIAKASSRSTPDIHLYNLIKSCDSIIPKYGGHKQAAGLSIKATDLAQLKTLLNTNILTMEKEDISDSYNSLGVLMLKDVGAELYNLIESFRPFGQENSYPLFTFNNITILQSNKIGKNKEYQKLVVTDGMVTVDILVFIDIETLQPNQTINFIGTISQSIFRGDTTYNIHMKELKHIY